MKVLAIVLGIIFVLAAIATATGVLNFSHALGFDGTHHTKHAILYAIIAIVCFAWARMSGETAPAGR
jgi:Co/Zn/Cd efflux system component